MRVPGLRWKKSEDCTAIEEVLQQLLDNSVADVELFHPFLPKLPSAKALSLNVFVYEL